MKHKTVVLLLVVAPAALGLVSPTTAQIYFEKTVSDEVAILENPPESVMAKVTTTNVVPTSLQNTKYKSHVKVTELLEVAYAKGDKTTAYGSVVRITGKAFLAVYDEINISPDGSVDTGTQRIEKVGQPTTRLDISGLKQELYYAGKLWKPTSDSTFILCTDAGITGINVSVKDSPLKRKRSRSQFGIDEPNKQLKATRQTAR